MAAPNTRARTTAVIILLIAGILVIAASASIWQARETAIGHGADKGLAPRPEISVDAGADLQYFQNVTSRPVSTTFFQSNRTGIPIKSLTPDPSYPFIQPGTSSNTYSINYFDRLPTPVRLNNTKSQIFPISQTKPVILKPVATLKPYIPIIIPLPTLIPRTPVPDKTTPSTVIVDDNTHQVEQRIFYYTNIERVNAGKTAFTWDEQLSVIGRDHCIDMATTGLFDHINFDGETPTDRAVRHGYQVKKEQGTYVRVGIAENIAKLSNYPGTPDEVARFIVESWMDSPGHRANLLDTSEQKLTLIGVGVAYDQPTATYYAAQEFF